MNHDDLHWLPTTLSTNCQKKKNSISKTDFDIISTQNLEMCEGHYLARVMLDPLFKAET